MARRAPGRASGKAGARALAPGLRRRSRRRLVFATPTGAPLGHSNFRQRVWLPALRQAGLSVIHFHDLRHTGNVLAANAGAGLRELMDRLGHSTTRAALVYLHGSDEQQRAVAEALSQLTMDALNPRPAGRSGTQRARKRRRAS